MDLDSPPSEPRSSVSGGSESMSIDSESTSNGESLLYDVRSAFQMGTDVDVFAIGGTIPTTRPDSKSNEIPYIESPIIIRWDSGEMGRGFNISLPIAESDAAQEAFAQLLADYEPPTFGIGDQQPLDGSCFNARDLDSSKFSTNFNLSEYGVIDAVSQALTHSVRSKKVFGLGDTDEAGIAEVGIRAKLRSLNIHSAPCENLEHPVPKAQLVNQMGSLIVCLPQAHQGRYLGFVCKHAYPHASESSIENLHRTLKGLDMMVFQALYHLNCQTSVVAVLDDENYRQPATVRCETEYESDPKYGSQCYVTVAALLHPVIHWHTGDKKPKEPPNPHKIPEKTVNKTADGNPVLFSRKKVTWLNHMPGDKENAELAVTFPLFQKGSAGVGTYVSELAILARV